MGRTRTPADEEQLVRDAIREAHEAIQQLRDLLREVNAIKSDLIDRFETVHRQEIHQLSNHFTAESNRMSADLNRHVAHAQKIISEQIMAGEAVFDPTLRTVTIRFGPSKFDDNVPLPYPQTAPKETPS